MNLRKATEEDLQRFKECLAADPDHGEQDPDAWTAPPGEFMVFFDENGNRVFARIERVLKVSMQHDPGCRKRNTAAIIHNGFHWLLGRARENGFSEVIFESRAPRLIRFLGKLFGAEPVRETYCVRT